MIISFLIFAGLIVAMFACIFGMAWCIAHISVNIMSDMAKKDEEKRRKK